MKDYEKLTSYTEKLNIKTAISISQVQKKHKIKTKSGDIVCVNSLNLKGEVVDVEKTRPSSYTKDNLLIE